MARLTTKGGEMKTVDSLVGMLVRITIGLGIVWSAVMFVRTSLPAETPAEELECLVGMMLVDASGESSLTREKTQELIVEAATRNRDSTKIFGLTPPRENFCKILENGSTIYPPGWSKTIAFNVVGRKIGAIKKNPRYSGKTWNDALAQAKQVLSKGVDKNRCATHYIRVSPGYTLFTNEVEAQKDIRKTMKEDRNSGVVDTKFYCP